MLYGCFIYVDKAVLEPIQSWQIAFDTDTVYMPRRIWWFIFRLVLAEFGAYSSHVHINPQSSEMISTYTVTIFNSYADCAPTVSDGRPVDSHQKSPPGPTSAHSCVQSCSETRMVPFTYTPPLVCKNSSSSKWWPFLYSSRENTPFSDKNILYWGIFISFKIEWENIFKQTQIGGSVYMASTAAKKKAGFYPPCRNTLLCLLKRLYWRNTNIIKIGREIMFSGLTAGEGQNAIITGRKYERRLPEHACVTYILWNWMPSPVSEHPSSPL